MILNGSVAASTNLDQEYTVAFSSTHKELLFTLQNTSNGRTIGSTLVPIGQFASGATYVLGVYNLYSSVISQNPNNMINAVFIHKGGNTVEVAINAAPIGVTFRIFAR